MADPDPPVHLPNAEYVEIFNRSNHSIDLSGWNFCIGSSDHLFDLCYLEPKEYLILSHEKYVSDFETFGNFYGFAVFHFPIVEKQLY